MSADRDPMFHTSAASWPEEDTAEVNRQSVEQDAAPVPVSPPPSAPPPCATEVTTRIPPSPAGLPRVQNSTMRGPQAATSVGGWYEQPAPTPPARRHMPEAPAPPRRHFPEPPVDYRSKWNAAPQGRAQPVPAMGSGSAVEAISTVGVRSAGKMAPQRGWRRLLHVLTRINVGLSPDEIYEMALHARMRRNTRQCHHIGVFGLKGGVGKTAVTVALGSTLSKVRGDGVLAVDADPDGGNLADRSGRQSAATVADLLADKELCRYSDIRAYTNMNGSNLEVLSSQEYSGARREFDDDDWKGTAAIVSRYYNLVLADCGSGLFQPASRAVLSTASGLVIVSSAAIDGARQAAVTMDWLRQNGYQDLLDRSCVVINHTVSGTPSVDVDDLVRQFERHLRPGRVIVLPWDGHIAAGAELRLDLLGTLFRRRVTELAAALSDDFDGSGLR